MNGGRPSVSLVVLNWHVEEDTARCVESIRAQRCRASIEVIVVDNESTEESRKGLEAIGGCRIVRARRNLGFAGGMNVGASVATGDVIGLLNNDLVLAADWVQQGLDSLDSNPSLGMLGGTSFFWDDANPLYCQDNDAWVFHIVDPLSGASTLSGHCPNTSEVSSLDGSNLLIRRDLWTRVGGFDPDYFAYGEDLDLSARCSAAGFRLVYKPAMRTWHQRNASSDRFRLRRIFWSRRNHLYNVAKHFPEGEWRQRTWRLSADYIWYGVSGRASGLRASAQSPRLDTRTRAASVAAGLWGCTHRGHLARKRTEVLAQGLHDELWTAKVRQRNLLYAEHG